MKKEISFRLSFILLIALCLSSSLPAVENEMAVDEIIRELNSGEKDKEQQEEGEVKKIEKGEGEYKGFKLPWFPSLQNPFIGAGIDFLYQAGNRQDAYDNMNTMEMREAELMIYSNTDPFMRAGLLIAANSEGVAVEEAFLLCTGLPCDLQIKAGKYFADIGRLNKIHTHHLPFVEQPLAMQNFLGCLESLESEGVFLSYEPQFNGSGTELIWLAPTDFYWRIILGMFNEFTNRGPDTFYSQYLDIDGLEPANRTLKNFAYTASSRWFFQLNPDHSLRLDLSGMFDSPAAGAGRRLQTVAFTYKWFPLKQGLYKNLEWSAEAFFNQEGFVDSGNQNTYGGYSYLTCKLNQRYTLGVLGEWSLFRYDKNKKSRHLGVTFSYFPSERQMVRFEIGYHDRAEWLSAISEKTGKSAGDGKFYQVSLQWVTFMGAHTHSYE